MKVFNKLVSLLLSVAVILPALQVGVSAADAGWTLETHGNTAGNRFVLITDHTDYIKEGNSALFMKYIGFTVNQSNYIEAVTPLTGTLTQGETYTLSFWSNGVQATNALAYVGDREFTYAAGGLTAGTPEEVGGKTWTPYSVSFTADGTEDVMSFRAYRITTTSVDNVSLTDASGTEYIPDGGFENYFTEDAVELPYDRTDYQPKQMMISPLKDNELMLHWINPATSDLSRVSVYNITNGAEELVTNAISTQSSELIYQEVTGLQKNTQYQFKVVFEFTGKTSDSYYIYGKTAPADTIEDNSYKRGGWEFLLYRGGAAKVCPAEITLDTTENHTPDGTTSVKIVSHLNSTYSGDIFARILHPNMATVVAGKRYRVSFWMKGENVRNNIIVDINGKKFRNENDEQVGSVPKPGSDWTYYEYTYDYQNEHAFRFLYESATCDALWLDDVEMREIDADGNLVLDADTGKPLPSALQEGDFEGLATTSVGTIRSATATGGNGTITLSDFGIAGSCDRIKIYQKVFDSYEARGSIPKDSASVTISGLKKNTEYTFRLVPVNEDGIEGEGKEVTGETILFDYEIGDAELYNFNNVYIEGLEGPGNYTMKMQIKNNKKVGGFNVEGLVCVYKDDALVSVSSSADTAWITGITKDPTLTLSIPFVIPDDGGSYTASFYLIDSRANLVHLTNEYSF